ncbi:MarR family winged helix-turn-helix transcriptional regulator [Angustibacter sp. McL0619]|uniref:MarR family winged helix-turn-helix transcriptional regulator n=1 Tax=Angustibacter sp. McL0619 TaxID=3415676 RepID=UPI003CF5A0E0
MSTHDESTHDESRHDESRHAELTARIALRMQEVIASAVLTNERIARMIGLNVVDFQTYGLLLRRGAAMTPGEVSARTALPSSTTTRVLDRLEAKGLIRREAAADDRRKVLVHALPFDAEEVGRAYEEILEQMAVVHRGYSADELELVERYLGEIGSVGSVG